MNYSLEDYTEQVETVKRELETLKEIAEDLRDTWEERINCIDVALVGTEDYE